MKRLYTLLFALIVSASVLAQDTTIIQTLTYDSITTRRGWWQFPEEGNEYRKVLMYYTLKCDAATTQDQFNCGEWDYLTYTYLYDHTGVLDSTPLQHPHYLFGTQNTDSLAYATDPLYDIFWSYNEQIVYDTVSTEDTATIGLGLVNDPVPFNSVLGVSRSQYLWRASELTSSGLVAGGIDRIMMDIGVAGTQLKGLTIRMKHTTDTALYSFSVQGFTQVYLADHNLTGTGWNIFDLTSEFQWDGTSNLIVEYSYEGVGNSEVMSDTIAYNSGIHATANEGHVVLDNGNYLEVPLGGMDLGSEITISFWSNGDVDVQPENSYIFEGLNTDGQRVLNCHLPWSNGRIYWDAGEGSGYDRIDKAATQAEYEGNWVHWAFTKNATNGTMKIFKNGVLWHSGSGLNRAIGQVDRFFIGRSGSGNANWHGLFDEFRIWDVELDEATIADWMDQPLTASHPNYADLVVNYDFNSGYDIPDLSVNDLDAVLFGAPQVSDHPSTGLFMQQSQTQIRPRTAFIQGEYSSHLDSVTVMDSVLVPPTTWVEFGVNGNSVYPINSGMGWVGMGLEYGPDGSVLDTSMANISDIIYNDTLFYYGPAFEIIDRFEIGRYITPYGINLSLGPEGFRWIFDVTDYAHLLHDSVDLSAGNQQELIDLQFVMIEGEPMAPVVELTRPWGQSGSKSYANLDNDVSLAPVNVDLHSDAEHFRIKTRLTGHGHNSTTGNYPHCCEWKDNTHYFHVNGDQVADWHIWQTHDCAQNPVYPQGGTWPGSREGWCPGDVVKDFEFQLTDHISGNTAELDYSITPVPTNNQGMGSGNYIVGMHFMQYGQANSTHDAEVYDVVNPNNWEYYSRTNPMCSDARIIIRNAGSTTLTSAKITYKVEGGTELIYNWIGSLGFMEKETVDLPIDLPGLEFWWGDGSNRFTVTISEPNGEADQNTDNSTYTTHYNPPPNYAESIVIRFKTNNFNDENSYELFDVEGNVVFSKYATETSPNTDYRDTVYLDPGCYTFKLYDTENDGLSYWAWPDQGNGSCRLRENGGSTLKVFEPEFGREVTHAFTVGGSASIDKVDSPRSILLYPNPTQGKFELELDGYQGNHLIKVITGMGQTVLSQNVDVQGIYSTNIDLSQTGAGIYFVLISDGEQQEMRKVVVR